MTGNDMRLEQSQKLAMTPELVQAINLLQLNTQELSAFIWEQILSNPVLETEEGLGEKAEGGSDGTYETEETIQHGDPQEEHVREPSTEWGVQADRLREWMEDDISYSPKGTEEGKAFGFENISVHRATLQDNMLMQLYAAAMSPKQQKIAEYLIELMDDNGYFSSSVKEVAGHFKTEEEAVEEILRTLQTFEPAGVGARNLEECLKLQLINFGVYDEKYERLLHEFLHSLADNKISWIAKQMNVSRKEVEEMCGLIKTLEPKPGRQFATSEKTQYIFPDLLLEKINDEYVVILNDSSIPTLRVNSYYRSLLEHSKTDQVLEEYLKDKMGSALRLLKNIDQRNRTIVAVASAIVNYQKDFFEGCGGLKPMTLKEIADEISVHESTVSRCVKGKYMETERGIYELKFFFSSGYTNTVGEQVSAFNIKKRIKEIVKQENPKKPLGDQNIAQLLEQEGIYISRRTIAKYRDELGILSSSKRRR